MNPLRIGTRGSTLALWQANHLRGQLARRAQVESELVILKTSGDRFAASAVDQLGVVGVFTKELEDALRSKRIDLAIHSMKDVPTEFSPLCRITVVFEREDPRDALVTRERVKLEHLPRAARIATSSLRRASQLRAFRPDFRVVEIRGNVDTRLRKLDAGEFDALVLAHAGLIRLGMANRVAEILSPEIMLSAVGQGALGVEFLAVNEDVYYGVLETLIDRKTALAITAERAFQARMQGGCRVPLGAWARFDGESLLLDGCVLSLDGAQSIRRHRATTGNITLADAATLGRELGEEIAEAGGGDLLRRARRLNDSEKKTKAVDGLSGKRIVITRAPEHSVGLTKLLECSGAEVVQLPMVRFLPPADPASMDAAIHRIGEFDWILFTSQVAVEFYVSRCRSLGFLPIQTTEGAQRKTKVAAVGWATANAANAQGLAVDYIAETERGEGLAAELAPTLRGKLVFLPHSNLGGEPLTNALRNAGVHVTSVEAYRTVAPEAVDPNILARIREGQMDVVIFASPSAFRNFAANFENGQLQELSRLVQFAAIGPTTRKTLETRGIKVLIEAEDPSPESMVQALASHFRGAATHARMQ